MDKEKKTLIIEMITSAVSTSTHPAFTEEVLGDIADLLGFDLETDNEGQLIMYTNVYETFDEIESEVFSFKT